MVYRTYCDTLYEMRRLLKKTNWLTCRITVPQLQSLVEECQVYGNRMEAGLDFKKDLNRLHEEKKALKKEVSDLEDKKQALQKQIEIAENVTSWEKCVDHAP